MTSHKQVEANRRNAQRSTGPKTSDGKAIAARNAVKHGALATVAVPGFESEAAWEEHRAAVVGSLYPAGFLEEELAERIALCLWRLKRVARAEREVIAISQESVEDDYAERVRFSSDKPKSLEISRDAAKRAKAKVRLLERLPKLADEARLAADGATTILYALADAVRDDDLDLDEFEFPELPADVAFDDIDWTAMMVRRCLEALAEHDGRDAASLLDAATWRALAEAWKAEKEAQTMETAIDRLRRRRLLPDDETMATFSRYEASIERSLYRALHQLERLQAARIGREVEPPRAIDVDVTVSEAG